MLAVPGRFLAVYDEVAEAVFVVELLHAVVDLSVAVAVHVGGRGDAAQWRRDGRCPEGLLLQLPVLPALIKASDGVHQFPIRQVTAYVKTFSFVSRVIIEQSPPPLIRAGHATQFSASLIT